MITSAKSSIAWKIKIAILLVAYVNSNLIQNSNKNIKFWLHRRNNSTKVFNITTNESLYLCGISLFYPTIYETIKQINIPYLTHYNDIYCEIYNDPEDVIVEFIECNYLSFNY